MSRKLTLSVVGLVGLVLLAGCIKAKTVVTVEKDGSGTVEQTMHTKALDLGFPGMEKPTPEEELAAAREQAEKNAQKMGEGVTVQAVERAAPRDGWSGIRTVYAFQDVTKLNVEPMPDAELGGGLQMGGPGPGGAGFPPAGPGAEPGETAPMEEEDDDDPVRFEFTAGPTPKLTILTPPMTPPAEAGPPEGEGNQQEQAMAQMMMMQFLDGMLVEVQVKVAGRITDTNAKYVSASRQIVGLLRMDFGALTKNPAAFGKLMSMGEGATSEEVEKQLQDPALGKHIKMETQERVEITFE